MNKKLTPNNHNDNVNTFTYSNWENQLKDSSTLIIIIASLKQL